MAFAVGTGTASVPAHAQTPAQKMLDAHNNERKNYHNVSLQWSPELATYAQQWAEGLAQKKQPDHRSNTKDNPLAPGQSVGENIAFNYGGANAGPDAVQQWISEKQYYNYAQDDGFGGHSKAPGCTPAEGYACGHFTQVVWQKTTHLGCGIGSAQDEMGTRQYVVCNYYPAGNMGGEKPYGEEPAGEDQGGGMDDTN